MCEKGVDNILFFYTISISFLSFNAGLLLQNLAIASIYIFLAKK